MERKKAEAKAGMPDMANVLKYIEEKEENLSNYNDKLRQNMVAIADIFGDSSCCRRCGRLKSDASHFKYEGLRYGKGVHKIPEDGVFLANLKDAGSKWGNDEGEYYVKTIDKHNFLPKIDISINYTDESIFHSDSDWVKHDFFLSLHKGELEIKEVIDDDKDAVKYISFSRASRYLLKKLVQSKRLLPFFQKLGRKVAENTKEYEEVSEIAERMAKYII